ncbi:MAG: hypothetical protein AAFO72_09350 [Pseudomonadota bacterium]
METRAQTWVKTLVPSATGIAVVSVLGRINERQWSRVQWGRSHG